MTKYEQSIAAEAEASPEREVCGILLSINGEIVARSCRNISPVPHDGFYINAKDYLPFLKDKTLVGYYHSHTVKNGRGAQPSEPDKRICENIGLPCHIYSVHSKEFFVLVPSGYQMPLIGRSFCFGICDCYTLVEDYYKQTLNIEMPDVDRSIDNMINGLPSLMSYIKEAKCKIVDKPQEHDIVCMAVGSMTGQCNHVGIYLSDNRMLHQLRHKASEVVVYGGYWQKHNLHYVRHESKI